MTEKPMKNTRVSIKTASGTDIVLTLDEAKSLYFELEKLFRREYQRCFIRQPGLVNAVGKFASEIDHTPRIGGETICKGVGK